MGDVVVNDQVTSAASALPARSLTPAWPALIKSVYVDYGRSPRLVDAVAVRVAALYVTVTSITAAELSRTSNDAPVTLAGSRGSLNTAATEVASCAFVAPMAGDTLMIVGGVTSAPTSVV